MSRHRRSSFEQNTKIIFSSGYKPIYTESPIYILQKPSGDKHHKGITKPEDAGRDETSVQGREGIKEPAIQTSRETARAKPADDDRPGKLTELNLRRENAVAARWRDPGTAGLYYHQGLWNLFQVWWEPPEPYSPVRSHYQHAMFNVNFELAKIK